jgi:crotonobetainyl-CoA:carnitine CoA-transferase CaiB-like acyl-CoA transferase
VGQHTVELLGEIGYADDEIERLATWRAVGWG